METEALEIMRNPYPPQQQATVLAAAVAAGEAQVQLLEVAARWAAALAGKNGSMELLLDPVPVL